MEQISQSTENIVLNEKEILVIEERIISVLKTVYDPEIPVDIFELGLIYAIDVQRNGNVHVTMTLTSPNCPAAAEIPAEMKEKIETLASVNDVEIEITFDPPWNQDLMSEEAKLELGML